MRAHYVDPRQGAARPCARVGCRTVEVVAVTTWARRGGLCSSCYRFAVQERADLEARRIVRRRSGR